jgi:hypothetical protein
MWGNKLEKFSCTQNQQEEEEKKKESWFYKN